MRMKKGGGLIRDIRKNPFSYLLILPATIYVFLFGYCTLPYLVIAFQKFNYKQGIFHSEFVGLKNFEFFFKSPKFLEVTFNTVFLNFMFIGFVIIFALIFSLMLNEARGKIFRKVTQSTLLLPNFMSWVVVSYIVYALFASDYGIVNVFLKSIGASPVSWYSSPGPWRVILVLIKVWKDTGMQVVIYLAAITGIDTSLSEAAKVDGASRLQTIRHIIFPLMIPTVSILALLSIEKIFYGDFGMIYGIIGDNGVLYPTTDVIDTYVFRAMRKTGDPSQAMAVGLYQSLMGFLFVFGSNWIASKKTDGGALF